MAFYLQPRTSCLLHHTRPREYTVKEIVSFVNREIRRPNKPTYVPAALGRMFGRMGDKMPLDPIVSEQDVFRVCLYLFASNFSYYTLFACFSFSTFPKTVHLSDLISFCSLCKTMLSVRMHTRCWTSGSHPRLWIRWRSTGSGDSASPRSTTRCWTCLTKAV